MPVYRIRIQLAYVDRSGNYAAAYRTNKGYNFLAQIIALDRRVILCTPIACEMVSGLSDLVIGLN
jgi:hypothetical protein